MMITKPLLYFHLLAALFICIFIIGCSSIAVSDDGSSTRFGCMANTETSQIRETEGHHVLISNSGYPCTITDYLGHEVTFKEKPERTAVLSGSFLNMWYAVGGKSICRTGLRTRRRRPKGGAAAVPEAEGTVGKGQKFGRGQAGQREFCQQGQAGSRGSGQRKAGPAYRTIKHC